MDLFVCHADADKDLAALPVARALVSAGLKVWIDDEQIRLGDSLREAIDRGLARCRWGVVILSPAFFGRNWPKQELDALVSREGRENRKVILPVWHGVDADAVAAYSPLLAARFAAKLSRGIDAVCDAIQLAISVSEPATPVERVAPAPRYRTNPDGTFNYLVTFQGAKRNVEAFKARLFKLSTVHHGASYSGSGDYVSGHTEYTGRTLPEWLESLAMSDGVRITTSVREQELPIGLP